MIFYAWQNSVKSRRNRRDKQQPVFMKIKENLQLAK